jgi:hypothetical protein
MSRGKVSSYHEVDGQGLIGVAPWWQGINLSARKERQRHDKKLGKQDECLTWYQACNLGEALAFPQITPNHPKAHAKHTYHHKITVITSTKKLI